MKQRFASASWFLKKYMKIISKLSKLTLIICIGLILVPNLVGAQTTLPDPASTNYGLNTVGANLAGDLPFAGDVNAGAKLPAVIGNIFRALLGLMGLIFLILIVYGGFRWMLARGDKGEVDTAKDIMVDALIGLIIVVSAFAIVNFVFDELVVKMSTI